MKKFLFILAVAATSCAFNVNSWNGKRVICKGEVIEKQLDFQDFNAIVVNGHADITILQSDEFIVSVLANEEVFEHLDYSVKEGALYIETKNNVNIKAADKYEITVSMPCLEGLTVNGAADALLKDYSSDSDMSIKINGAGDIDISSAKLHDLSISVNGAGDINAHGIDVEKLIISVNGAGDAKLSGKAVSASFGVSGAGDIDARNLECDDVQTRKSGAATIKL